MGDRIFPDEIYFQIGTWKGNDNFLKIVKEKIPTMVIIVEPNSSLIDEIKSNYDDIDNYYIYNNAVYYTNEEDVGLYIGALNNIYGIQSPNGITYCDAHYSLVPMNDWGSKEHLIRMGAKSITFDEICQRHSIKEIEYLEMGTNGFDSEIINMIDFGKYKIKKILFENWNFNPECFKDHNEDKWERLGKIGTKNAIDKLKASNYTVVENNCFQYLATLNE